MVPAGSFSSRIPKVWPCKLMMELWGHPSYSSTHDSSQSRQGLALYVLSTVRRYSLGRQICFKDLLGFLVGEVHGQKGKSADLITCLAGWFLASRVFLTWCESLSLTGVLQRKHVSQPDLHTWIVSALPCNWKGDLGHRSGRKHSQTWKASTAPKMGGCEFTLWCLSALVISSGPVISIAINNTANVLPQKLYLLADAIPVSVKTLLCPVFAVAKWD